MPALGELKFLEGALQALQVSGDYSGEMPLPSGPEESPRVTPDSISQWWQLRSCQEQEGPPLPGSPQGPCTPPTGGAGGTGLYVLHPVRRG